MKTAMEPFGHSLPPKMPVPSWSGSRGSAAKRNGFVNVLIAAILEFERPALSICAVLACLIFAGRSNTACLWSFLVAENSGGPKFCKKCLYENLIDQTRKQMGFKKSSSPGFLESNKRQAQDAKAQRRAQRAERRALRESRGSQALALPGRFYGEFGWVNCLLVLISLKFCFNQILFDIEETDDSFVNQRTMNWFNNLTTLPVIQVPLKFKRKWYVMSHSLWTFRQSFRNCCSSLMRTHQRWSSADTPTSHFSPTPGWCRSSRLAFVGRCCAWSQVARGTNGVTLEVA